MSARSMLAERFDQGTATSTKTFVLEVHADDPETALSRMFGTEMVTSTKDAFLHRAVLDDGNIWVDQLDPRFWSFHTDLPAQPVKRFLHERVQGARDLDWLWLPAQHLRHASDGAPARRITTDFRGAELRGGQAPGSGLRLRAAGVNADALLDYLEKSEDFAGSVAVDGIEVAVEDGFGGTTKEAVNSQGDFASSGDSFDTHVQFVRSVVGRYAAFVQQLEASALGWDALPDDGGGVPSGAPVGILFSESVPDLDRFVDALFRAREPFRLWGKPSIVDGVAEVEAVDLHVGQRLRFDIGQTWMRVYLERGGCGNTVARLISNLQHRFDSRLSLTDPVLQAAMVLTAGG